MILLTDRKEFRSEGQEATPFKKLVNSPKKKVNIKGEYDFTGGGLKIPTEIVPVSYTHLTLPTICSV